jgi:two-component system cell cycle sensor histidine kinase/response regulator CckA
MMYFPQPSPAGSAPAGGAVAPAADLSAEQLGVFFDLSPDLLCLVGFDGRFRALNAAWEKMLGFSKDEILANPRVALIHPDDREAALQRDLGLAAGGPATIFENRYRRKDGSYIWVQWSQVVMADRRTILATGREISERKFFEAELRQSHGELEVQVAELSAAVARANSILLAEITHRREVVKSLCEVQEKYRSVVENAVEGIFQSTPEGTYLSVNPALARIKGYDSPEALIVDMENIGEQSYVDPKRRLEFKQLMETQGVAMGFEYEAYRRGGEKIWLSMNARAVRDTDGQLLYYEGTVEDITERRQMAAQLRTAQKMEAVGQLAGGIAHDFNNLLGVINGHTELLLGHLPEGSSSRWSVDAIHKASKRAVALVRQLLAFSRRQALNPTVLDLNSVVRDVESMLARIVGDNIVLATSLDNALGPVKADQSQIEQVVINLVVNARDAMPQGGKLTIHTANVDVAEKSLMAQGGYVPAGRFACVTVTDTGTGMDAATQNCIFEPFFTTKEQGKGTGLGLATVYGVIKQSGGFISVHSEPEKGSSFQVLLPRLPARECYVPKPELPERSWEGSETVLLVEDDLALRELLLSLLVRLGYKVLEASNGAQATKIARQLGDEIDLLLTDVVMPGINGPKLADELVRLQPSLKVLYMSGYPEHGRDTGQISVLGKPMLQKPFKQIELAQKLREILEDASAKTPAQA